MVIPDLMFVLHHHIPQSSHYITCQAGSAYDTFQHEKNVLLLLLRTSGIPDVLQISVIQPFIDVDIP